MSRANNEAGATFVEDFGIGATSDFTVTTHGDEENHALAKAWAYGVAWIHDAYVAAGRPPPHARILVLAAYVETGQMRSLDMPDAPASTLEGLRRARRVAPRN